MCVDDLGIEVIVVSLEFHAKLMLHSNISNFQQSKYSNQFLELLLRALGIQILRYYFEYLDRGELFQGGPFIS